MIQKLRSKEFNSRLARVSHAIEQNLIKKNRNIETLHIVYAMTHVGISGGVKVIFEHTNRLKKLGAKATIVSHFQKPSWFPIEAEYIQVPFDLELAKGIPDCDIIVATYWDHIQACIETGIAPVVYFEQGDFHLFDYESMNQKLKHFIQKQFHIPPFIYTVSNQASELIKKIYGREAKVYPNAVDERIFTTKGAQERGERPYLLMVGGESATFKGISDIMDAYEKVKDKFNIDLYWITPEKPSEKMKQRVTKVFVSPTQEKIASLYRGAALYVCGSTYENFPLPPLEAMACGCPVVTTNNKGSLEYAVHPQNALICNMKDSDDMADKIKELLSNPVLKETLMNNGLATANQFKWDIIMGNILSYYQEISSHEVLPRNTLNDWEIIISEEDCMKHEDYTTFNKFLLVTSADIVKVPVVYHIDKVPAIARWEVAAIRKNDGEGMVERLFCPVNPFNKFQIYNLKGYQSFLMKQFDKALDEFIELYKSEQTNDQAVAGRWIIVTLMRLQRKEEAKRRVKELMKQHPYNADLYKLSHILGGNDDNKDLYSINAIKLLGDATSYSEFFYMIHS